MYKRMKKKLILKLFQPRTITLGMCLPSACSLNEIVKMATLSQKSIPNRDVQVLGIRSPTQNPYEYWKDTTFIVLL